MRKKWVAYQEIKNGTKVRRIDNRQKKENKKVGRNANSVDEFTNQKSVLHMGRNATGTKRRITGQAVV